MSHVAANPGDITTISTPNVEPSKVWQAIVGIFLCIIALVSLTIWYFNTLGDKSYDMKEVGYGEILTCIVKAGHHSNLTFTNDYFEFSSDGELQVMDVHKNPSVLSGNSFIEGVPVIRNSDKLIFTNNTKNDITLQVAKCKSKNECNINFTQKNPKQ